MTYTSPSQRAILSDLDSAGYAIESAKLTAERRSGNEAVEAIHGQIAAARRALDAVEKTLSRFDHR